jgi:hypothetical protein
MLENLVSTCNVTCGCKSKDIDLIARDLQNLKYRVRNMFKSSISYINRICRIYVSWNGYQKVNKSLWDFSEILDIFRRVCTVIKFAVLHELDRSFLLVVWYVPDDQGIGVRLPAKPEIFLTSETSRPSVHEDKSPVQWVE